jgi:hypothetical protein
MRVEKEPIVRSPRGRPVRTPAGARNILSVRGKEPGYEYRVVNDDFGRIEDFVERGWEFVDANAVKVGESRVDNPHPEGTKASIQVGRSAPKKAYVMRIKKEFWDEDQALKKARVDELESTMKQDVRSSGGTLDITR